MTFINKNLGRWVLAIKNNAPDFDLLATLSQDKNHLVLLGVNKGNRDHHMFLGLPWSFEEATLQTFSELGREEKIVPLNSSEVNTKIRPRTIFSLKMKMK